MIYNYYRTERLYLFESNKFLINTVVKSDRFREIKHTLERINFESLNTLDTIDNYLNNP